MNTSSQENTLETLKIKSPKIDRELLSSARENITENKAFLFLCIIFHIGHQILEIIYHFINKNDTVLMPKLVDNTINICMSMIIVLLVCRIFIIICLLIKNLSLTK